MTRKKRVWKESEHNKESERTRERKYKKNNGRGRQEK